MVENKSQMVPARPLLTIAIPTFNRGALLAQALESLLDQIPSDGSVEVIVCDNASPDQTPLIVEDYRKDRPWLQYIRNKTNIGPDANFLQCYERATGKYVWLFSDDDLFCPGALRHILGYLSGDEYDLVYVSSSGFTNTPKCKPSPTIARALVFTEAVRFLRRVHIFTTLVSGNIINKERVEANGHQPFSELIGTNLCQLGWTFAAIRGHRKSLVITEELICYRLGNTGGYGVCRVFGPTLRQVTEEWLGIPKLCRIILNASLQRLIPACLFAANQNRRGNYLAESAHEVMRKEFSRSGRYWIFDYPLIVLPRGMAAAWFLMLRIFNRLDRTFGYPSLSW